MESFADRFFKIASTRSSFCFGLDPSEELMNLWGFKSNKKGLSDFCSLFLEAIEESGAGIIKPQVAFFEAFGPGGMFVLKEVILKAKELKVLVIADIKRGDIGKTSKAYARGWFGNEEGFQVDAVTLHPYFGFEALMPFIESANRSRGGVFVVLRSSNKEALGLQRALVSEESGEKEFLFRYIGSKMQSFSEVEYSGVPVGSLGAVIGGNLDPDEDLLKMVKGMEKSLFLVPGIGTQGGTFESIQRIFGRSIKKVIPSSSSAVLKYGPSKKKLVQKMKELMEEVRKMQEL